MEIGMMMTVMRAGLVLCAVPALNVATAVEVLEGYFAPVVGWGITGCNDLGIWSGITAWECGERCTARIDCKSFDFNRRRNDCYLSTCTRETAPPGSWKEYSRSAVYEKKTAPNSQASDLVIGSKSVVVEGFTRPELNGVYTADPTKDIGGKVTMWHSSNGFYLFWCSADSDFSIASAFTYKNNRAGDCAASAHTTGANMLKAEFWNEVIDGVNFTPIFSVAVVLCPNPAPAFAYTYPNEWIGTCGKALSRTEVESCTAIPTGCPCTAKRPPATEFGITNCCEETFNNNGDGACQDWQAGCVAGRFQLQQPSATQDRICSSCMTGQFSTATNAASCTQWRPQCGPGEYQAVVPTETRDRVCSPCPDGSLMAAEMHAEPACVAWDDCREAAVTSFEVTVGSGKAHPTCRSLTVCTGSQREVVPPTATSDRTCGNTTSTTTMSTVTSATSTTTAASTTIKSSASSRAASVSIVIGLGVLFLLVLLAVLCFRTQKRCTQVGRGWPTTDVTQGNSARGTPHVASNPM
jgi:hypothetical protein